MTSTGAPRRRVLILGGTVEARTLAARCAGRPGIEPITSLAGRTSEPARPAGRLRIGGFGGSDGLAAYLTAERFDAVIDATHPFAAAMTNSAVAAAAVTGIPLLVLCRPGWVAQPGDDWHRVPSMAAATAAATRLGNRIFVTTGRQTLSAFAPFDACWFLARSVDPPQPPSPRRLKVILDRGPFEVAAERALLARYRIDVLVSKDSGGDAAKLTAARECGLPVVLVDRPPLPPQAPAVPSVAAALDWLDHLGATAWAGRTGQPG